MKRNKSSLKKLCCALLSACLCVGGLAACGNPFVKETEKVNTSQVQLYVGAFAQGFGRVWIDEAARRFEEKYKDKSYTEGTKGVQVFVDPVKIGTGMIDEVQNSRVEVIFNENIDYYTWIKRGLVKDISSIVTADMESVGESGQTIEKKMNGNLKDYFAYTDGKYYGMPFYEATYGLQYDIDVFADNDLFMDKNGQFTLASQDDPNASAGPDGDYTTTVDNGLPATFSEFYALCATIKSKGMLPINWNGAYPVYVSRFLQSMAAYIDGYDEAVRKYTYTGDGKVVTSFSGNTPQITTKSISEANGYELTGSVGNYYALQFLQDIIDKKYYNESKAGSQEYSHLSAQDDFVLNKNVQTNSIRQDVAMLIDGTWFLNEAMGTLNDVAVRKPEGGADVRRFGLMPLPRPDAYADPIPYTYLDSNLAACMVSAQTDDSKMELVKDFLLFLHTDDEMRKFTVSTSTLLGYDYLDGWDVSQTEITPYGEQLIAVRRQVGEQVVYPMSNNRLYANNIEALYLNETTYFSAKIGRSELRLPVSAMIDNKITAKAYFEGMQVFHSAEWWRENFRMYYEA